MRFAEREVGPGGDGGSFFAFGDDLEEQLGAAGVDLDVTEFIEEQEVEAAVAANADASLAKRPEWQLILDRDELPELRVLRSESVLARKVGGPDVMRDQMAHLAGLAGRPMVTIQVLPDSAAAYGGLSGGFAVATERPSGEGG